MRSRIFLALGLIQVLVGALVALRPLYGTGAPLTGSRALDMAFAVFFLIRGVMNIRAASRSPAAAARHTAPPPS